MATTVAAAPPLGMKAGVPPGFRLAVAIFLGHGLLWAYLLFRWFTFSAFDWRPLPFELALGAWPPTLYLALLVVDLVAGLGLLWETSLGRWVGTGRAVFTLAAGILYYFAVRDFFSAIFLVGLSGFLLILLRRETAWSLAYPAAFWLAVFFIAPLTIVFVVSLGERTRLGTVAYPAFRLDNLGVYFDDYARFFSRIGGDLIYLRIFWRSLLIAIGNTAICLAFGYPFAYWIARQAERYRNALIFLVMIPFWTNFLVRTYAWILILRDSGLINSFWTVTLHEQVVMLADKSRFFAGLAELTDQNLTLLPSTFAVMLGLFYGYLPFMVLPLYTALERMDWSLMEAAADLGADRRRSITRVLLPLTAPGIVAGSIIVFIPSLGAYVTPDLMGGAKVALVGNLLQQQFMSVRDWPFGSAIGFIVMSIMLLATVVYFRWSAGATHR
jgi:spermidine/putrescine transport system permease protein